MSDESRLAKLCFEEAQRRTQKNWLLPWAEQTKQLQEDWRAIVRLAVVEEREACAKLAEAGGDNCTIAAAIRERGNR